MKSERINIEEIETGFLIEYVNHSYDVERYAIPTWFGVLDFLGSKPPQEFTAEDITEAKKETI